MKKKIPLTYNLGGLPGLGLALLLGLFVFAACKNNSTRNQSDIKEVGPNPPPPCLHNDPNLRPLPVMFVGRDTSGKLEGAFTIKSGPLTDNLNARGINGNENEVMEYDTSAFNNMIRYFLKNKMECLDIWFAAYPSSKFRQVPIGYENKLTVLFAPVYNKDTIEGYYTLAPNAKGFDPKLGANRVNRDTAKMYWIRGFEGIKLPVITPGIDQGPNDNHTDQVGTNPSSVSDTRRIRYPMGNLKELLDEMVYQDTANKNPVGGVNLYFAAFTNSGNYKGRFRRRLIVQFEFMHVDSNGAKSIFSLEEDPKFCRRPFGPSDKFTDSLKGLDNGQLCPPACVPPPQSPVKP